MLFHLRKLLRKFSFLWLSLLFTVGVELLCVDVTSWWTWKMPALPKNSIVVLIVADPQLIGYKNEPKWIGWLSRWDSDRYLRNTYVKVASIVNPSVELFLGDLLDEGVGMNAKEFEYTRSRFYEIFPLKKNLNRIYIPGDNDVGGEMEPFYPHLEHRFKAEFPDILFNNSMAAHWLTITKFNVYKNFELKCVQKASENGAVKILLSHVPLLRAFDLFAIKKAIESFGPAIILSAHDHTTKVYLKNGSRLQEFDLTSNPFHHPFAFSSTNNESHLVEFKSPTVSYRMGVDRMGFAILTISLHNDSKSAIANYFIFWSPSRYPYLIFYAILVCLGVTYPIFVTLCKKIFACRPMLYKSYSSYSHHNC